MKKILILATVFVTTVHTANADCIANPKRYSSCKPGYYLISSLCLKCPSSGGINATSVDKNTGGLTSCYLPVAGTEFSDETGSGIYTDDCHYQL